MGCWTVAVCMRFLDSLRSLGMTVREISRLAMLARNDKRNDIDAVIVTAVLVALKGGDHFFYEVVDVEKFHFDAAIVDLDWKVVSDVVAEGRYC